MHARLTPPYVLCVHGCISAWLRFPTGQVVVVPARVIRIANRQIRRTYSSSSSSSSSSSMDTFWFLFLASTL
jgi:hypothetical protein